MEKYPAQREIEIKYAGTGMMVITREVLNTLSKTAEPFKYIHPATGEDMPCWEFFPSGASGGIYRGEDWSMVEKTREAGFKTYINPYVQIGHHGDGSYFIKDEL